VGGAATRGIKPKRDRGLVSLKIASPVGANEIIERRKIRSAFPSRCKKVVGHCEPRTVCDAERVVNKKFAAHRGLVPAVAGTGPKARFGARGVTTLDAGRRRRGQDSGEKTVDISVCSYFI